MQGQGDLPPASEDRVRPHTVSILPTNEAAPVGSGGAPGPPLHGAGQV